MVFTRFFFLFFLLNLSMLGNALCDVDKPLTLSQAQTTNLDMLISQATQKHGIIGQSVAILHKGVPIYVAHEGLVSLTTTQPVTDDTIFPLYSVSKLYFTTLIAKLVVTNQLDVTQPVGFYLKDLPEHWRKIKVRSLLAHTSGLPEFFDVTQKTSHDPLHIISSLRDRPLVFPTDSQVQYNQTNFLLLKLIVEAKFGNTLESLIATHISGPLALDKTHYGGIETTIAQRSTHYYIRDGETVTDNGVPIFAPTMFAATGLNANLHDVSTWFSALVKGEFFPQTYLTKMWQPFYLTNGLKGDYHHGWQYLREGETTVVGHYGGNIINIRHFYTGEAAEKGVTIIHLTNGGFGPDFNPFDFSYALATSVQPSIVLPSIEFKQRILSLAKRHKTNKIRPLFIEFQQQQRAQGNSVEMLVNELGYQLLSAYPEASVTLFELNTESYPHSANTYDSYAEALYTVGEVEKARANYLRAYQLNPGFSHIPAILNELNQ